MQFRRKGWIWVAVAAVSLATVATVVGTRALAENDEPKEPFAELRRECWEGFDFELDGLPDGETAALVRSGEVLAPTSAEVFARQEPLAGDANLCSEPVLFHASVLAAYDTQQPFHGLAWAFDFEAEAPFSGGGMPVDGSLTSPRESAPAERTHLLVLVDAKTGALLAVAAVGLP